MDRAHDLSYERLRKSQFLSHLCPLLHYLVVASELHHHHVVLLFVFPDFFRHSHSLREKIQKFGVYLVYLSSEGVELGSA